MKGDVGWIIYLIVSGLVAMFAIEAGVMGYLTKPSTILERIIYTSAGLLILGPLTYSIAGYVLFAIGYLMERFSPAVPIIGDRPSLSNNK